MCSSLGILQQHLGGISQIRGVSRGYLTGQPPLVRTKVTPFCVFRGPFLTEKKCWTSVGKEEGQEEGGWGGVSGQKKVCVPKIGLKFSGPFDKFHVLPEEKFL